MKDDKEIDASMLNNFNYYKAHFMITIGCFFMIWGLRDAVLTY